jgi:hypothetical protein
MGESNETLPNALDALGVSSAELRQGFGAGWI